jgi:hypothetical protein
MQVKSGREKACRQVKEAHLLMMNDSNLPFADGESGFHMEDDNMTCTGLFKRSKVYGNEKVIDAIAAAAANFLGAPDEDSIQYSANMIWDMSTDTLLCQFRYPQAALYYQKGSDQIQ